VINLNRHAHDGADQEGVRTLTGLELSVRARAW
jgi:hypothetical protein